MVEGVQQLDVEPDDREIVGGREPGRPGAHDAHLHPERSEQPLHEGVSGCLAVRGGPLDVADVDGLPELGLAVAAGALTRT